MKVFLLEDDPARIRFITEWVLTEPIDALCVATNFERGVSVYKKYGPFDVLLLDHDLGTEKTGCDFARWVKKQPGVSDCLVIVHSMNPIGARNIAAEFLPVVVRIIPFGTCLGECLADLKVVFSKRIE